MCLPLNAAELHTHACLGVNCEVLTFEIWEYVSASSSPRRSFSRASLASLRASATCSIRCDLHVVW